MCGKQTLGAGSCTREGPRQILAEVERFHPSICRMTWSFDEEPRLMNNPISDSARSTEVMLRTTIVGHSVVC